MIWLVLNESSGLITLTHLVSILSDRIIEWGTVMKRHGRQHEGHCEVFILELPLVLCSYKFIAGACWVKWRFHYEVINMTSHRALWKPHTSWFIDVIIALAGEPWCHFSELLLCRRQTEGVMGVAASLWDSEVVCCMQSGTLQQYKDNPLSFSVCQDTNLTCFLSAVFAGPR